MSTRRNWSRREFNAAGLRLGAAGLLAASAGATRAAQAGVADQPRGAQPATPVSAAARGEAPPLKVGVIGCGGRGTGAIVNALNADPNAVLWAMGDVFGERLEPCLQNVRASIAEHEDDPEPRLQHQIQVDSTRRFDGFDCYRKVIESGVDVVILTTPPGFRPLHFQAAVEAGKHIFCEKPVAVDGPGVRAVLASARLAQERGLSVMSGFCWRYQDQVRETFAKLLSGGIGRIHTIQTTYNTTGWIQPKPRKPEWSDAEFMARNWHYFHPLSGDHIVEQAVHAIDWMAWAMGDRPPLRCWAVGGRQTRPDVPETGNVYDHFAVTYEYEGGVRGYHFCRHWPNTPSDNSAFIIGSTGACTMQPWTPQHTIEGDSPWRGTARSNDMYQREHDVLFSAIRSRQPINDGEFMAYSTLLGIMGRMAAYTGQIVTWDQALNSSEDLHAQPWTFSERAIPTMAVPGKTVLS